MDLISILLNLRQEATVTFEDLEGELLRLSEFEPLQQITGVAEFLGRIYGHKGYFNSSSGNRRTCFKSTVLLEQCPVGRVLEIGVGTGCIIFKSGERLVKRHHYMGCDISEEALVVAKKNRDKFNLQTELIYSDVYSNVPHEKFECIISNPPYIAFFLKKC